MSTLVDYKGLKVVDPTPPGEGGRAIQGDLKLLADRVASSRYVEGLRLAHVNRSTVDVGPGAAIAADGSLDLRNGGTLRLRLSAGGVNGLDAGAVAANAVYFVHLIADSSGARPVVGLFSLSASGPALPPGYDRSRRIGFVTTGASASILRFRQAWNGLTRRVFYGEEARNTRVLDKGRATVFTAVGLGPFVPETARSVVLAAAFEANVTPGASTPRAARLRAGGDSHAGDLYDIGLGFGTGRPYQVAVDIACGPSRTVEYLVSHAAAELSLSVMAVDDEL